MPRLRHPWHSAGPWDTTDVVDWRVPERNCRSWDLREHVGAAMAEGVLVSTSVSLLAWSVTLSGQDLHRRRSVLMLFSLRSTAPAVAELESTFRRTVESGLASPVDFHVEYLDLPETTGAPYAPELTALLRRKYAGRQFDLIAVQQSPALAFLLQNREALFSGVPVVFFDVGRAEFEALRPPADVTGALHVNGRRRDRRHRLGPRAGREACCHCQRSVGRRPAQRRLRAAPRRGQGPTAQGAVR